MGRGWAVGVDGWSLDDPSTTIQRCFVQPVDKDHTEAEEPFEILNHKAFFFVWSLETYNFFQAWCSLLTIYCDFSIDYVCRLAYTQRASQTQNMKSSCPCKEFKEKSSMYLISKMLSYTIEYKPKYV